MAETKHTNQPSQGKSDLWTERNIPSLEVPLRDIVALGEAVLAMSEKTMSDVVSNESRSRIGLMISDRAQQCLSIIYPEG
jgi:hypothetical protein